jgi:hypothetical protein
VLALNPGSGGSVVMPGKGWSEGVGVDTAAKASCWGFDNPARLALCCFARWASFYAVSQLPLQQVVRPWADAALVTGGFRA